MTDERTEMWEAGEALGHALGALLAGLWRGVVVIVRPVALLYGLRLLGVPISIGWRTVVGALLLTWAIRSRVSYKLNNLQNNT